MNRNLIIYYICVLIVGVTISIALDRPFIGVGVSLGVAISMIVEEVWK